MLTYDVVDVFTDRPFAGDQLAVINGADDLSAEQCLAIAQEFNFSETTFPSSTVVDGAEYSTRIFTPGGEIPFAGHPTLGTAWVLRSRGLLTGTDVTQVCGAVAAATAGVRRPVRCRGGVSRPDRGDQPGPRLGRGAGAGRALAGVRPGPVGPGGGGVPRGRSGAAGRPRRDRGAGGQ